jgi:hypothetical protein
LGFPKAIFHPIQNKVLKILKTLVRGIDFNVISICFTIFLIVPNEKRRAMQKSIYQYCML